MQTYGDIGKVPEFKGRLRESHPEVCFAVLAPKDDFYLPLYNSKHPEDGFWDRVEVLEEFYQKTRDFVRYISEHSVLRSHQIDCIDALCLAVSGLLGLRNGYTSIQEVPSKDARGLNMEIVYGKKNLRKLILNNFDQDGGKTDEF